MKKILLGALLVMSAAPSWGIIYKYGYFDAKHHQCRLIGWSGSQPTSGKLTLPSTYKHTDGITYDVVSVGPDALNNLTTVTEITIPASLDTIGEATSHHLPNQVFNFRNCPELTKFKVASGNPHFNVTSEGALWLEGGELIAVPAKMAVTSGAYTVPKDISSTSESAFAENTTIKKLTLRRDILVRENAGLNLAPNISSYVLTGTGDLDLIDGVLVDNSKGLVLSYPRAAKTAVVNLPTRIVEIAPRAFYKAAAMTEIHLEGIRKIGEYAFSESGLKNISFPAVLKEIGDHAMENCQSLKGISFTAEHTKIPDYFARNCKSLTTVGCGGLIDRVDDAAFKGCSALVSFPFSGLTVWAGDSAMYGCAFPEIRFKSGENSNDWHQKNTFSGNRHLIMIDASLLENTVKHPYCLWTSYADQCINLKTLKLPEFSTYSAFSSEQYIVPFGSSCMLERIEAHTIWNVENTGSAADDQMIRFRYSGGSDYKPDMFIAVSANRKLSPNNYNEWGLANMFQGGNGATVHPNVYVDASTPSAAYVDPIITYYIPGGCLSNYSEAVTAGAKVHEMYQMSIQRDGSRMKVIAHNPTKEVNGKPIDIYYIIMDNWMGVPDANGMVKSIADYDKISEVVVRYTLDGIKMETVYPREMWLQTGLEEETVAPLGIETDGDLIRFRGVTSDFRYRIISMQGIVLKEGNEPEVSKEDLTPGLYMIELTASGRSQVEKIRL